MHKTYITCLFVIASGRKLTAYMTMKDRLTQTTLVIRRIIAQRVLAVWPLMIANYAQR